MPSESPSSLLDVLEIVLPFFENDFAKASVWMLTPNENLGGESPVDLWNMGHKQRLMEFIENCIDENKI